MAASGRGGTSGLSDNPETKIQGTNFAASRPKGLGIIDKPRSNRADFSSGAARGHRPRRDLSGTSRPSQTIRVVPIRLSANQRPREHKRRVKPHLKPHLKLTTDSLLYMRGSSADGTVASNRHALRARRRCPAASAVSCARGRSCSAKSWRFACDGLGHFVSMRQKASSP